MHPLFSQIFRCPYFPSEFLGSYNIISGVTFSFLSVLSTVKLHTFPEFIFYERASVPGNILLMACDHLTMYLKLTLYDYDSHWDVVFRAWKSLNSLLIKLLILVAFWGSPCSFSSTRFDSCLLFHLSFSWSKKLPLVNILIYPRSTCSNFSFSLSLTMSVVL